jgi:magnesium transporter
VLASALLADHAPHAAAALETVPGDAVAAVLAAQPPGIAGPVLDRMVPARAGAALAALGPERAAGPLAAMSPARAASALSWLNDTEIAQILDAASARVAREVRELFAYPDDTAGSLMDPRAITVRQSDSVADAVARLAGITKPLHRVYVIDDEHTLIGSVAIQDLAVADRDAPISSLTVSEVEAVDAFMHREDVAEMLSRTATPTIAVVDAEGRLVGVLRHRVLLGIAEEEAASMMQQMVGANPDERALSPVSFAVKKRLPWLNINLLTAFLAAAVVGLFEGTIAKVTSLAVLLPVVAGQSGNSGSQALAVTMRGLALREIRAAHWPRVAAKELAVGVTNGIAIALVTGAGVWIWSGTPMLAAVISVAMVLSMAAAGLAGASIPIVLKGLGQDPAQSSSIILTTVTDVVGFSSFLGLATLLADKLV